MTRFVFPELFHGAAAPIVVEGQTRVALRWILHPSIGLPRDLFNVWHFEGRVPIREMSVQGSALDAGARLLSWTVGPGAAVLLVVTVPAGATFTLTGFSGPSASGHAVDEETVVGPVTNRSVVLFGSPVASVKLSGSGTIVSSRIVPIDAFVNDAGWKLVETVGLPAADEFATAGYPLTQQGPPGAQLAPVDAAINRVRRGTPDAGWNSVTDRGTAVPPHVTPDASQLVKKELRPLVGTVARMLESVSDPAAHAAASFPVAVKAPRSVHGVAASTHWQSKARDSQVFPLGSLLIAAGTDAFNALALGFGTTLGAPAAAPVTAALATQPVKFDFYMITVKHKVKVEVPMPLGLPPFPLLVDGEFATLCMELQQGTVGAPGSLTAEPLPLDPPRHIDPPGEVDGRWIESPNVTWAVPMVKVDSMARPTGYAVARGEGAGAMEIRVEPRLSGGWSPFVAAQDPLADTSVVVRFTDDGVPEKFPGDANTFVFGVASTDWFGRWSGWVSADHSRIVVPPQVPAMRRVSLDVPPSTTPVFPATAAVEFTWDWSHRRPREITLRVLVHADGTPVPAVNGSVLSVGGSTVPDLVLDFASASVDSPPSGVTIVADETSGNLRTYRVEVAALAFAYDSFPKVRVTATAQATERVGFGLPSAWSSNVSALAVSPIPPPPPFVPVAMVWASLPDPKGISRITLNWQPSAPRYAVYETDETTVCRELSLPSPDFETSAADRLVVLRPLAFGNARGAFKRLADNVTATSLRVELPRGSRMIHFYAIVPVSGTGVEGVLPASGNDYIAVASPRLQVPEPPVLIARDREGVVTLRVDVAETRVRVDRVEIFRSPNAQRSIMPEHAGPPIAVAAAVSGTRSNGAIHFELQDAAPGKAWQTAYYRAVAWAEVDAAGGLIGGRSEPSRALPVVVSSALPPALTDVKIEAVTGFDDHRLVSFLSEVTLEASARGVHVFALRIAMPDASVVTRRVAASDLPLLSGSMPDPTAQPDSIFRYDATEPRTGRTYAWVPKEAVAVVVEITDPSGVTTRETVA